ncbi:MAG: glutamate racemase [Myxococcota bacterium]
MADNRSIGVFDSGLGGLTVLSALLKKFPNESMAYLGDTARVPYGTKSPETVIKYALNNAKALMRSVDLKLLVVACNTATAHALPALQKELSIPVLGVIKPGAFEVSNRPEIKSVAVLATTGTIGSNAYEKTLNNQGYKGEVFSLACPLWVPLVEEGLIEGPIAESLARHYLDQLPKLPQAVILGCTHYPMLLTTLKKVMPAETIWIDSGHATAALAQFEPSNRDSGELKVYVTDAPERFRALSSVFLGYSVPERQIELIDVGVSE